MTRGRGRPAAAVAAPRRGTAMATRRQPESWLGRLANEVYVGAMVLGLGLAVAAVVAVLVAVAMRVNEWVVMAD